MDSQENVDVPVADVPVADVPVVSEEATVAPEFVMWEGHKVTDKGEEKMIGEERFFSCLCDDGVIYDVPESYFPA